VPLRCVVCVRNPADVVASALKRAAPEIDRWTYAERWLDYIAGALEATDADERLLVFYDDVLREPMAEARRLAAFLGCEEPDVATLAAIADNVDPEMRHHRSSAWDVVVDAGLPLEVRAAYVQLRALRRLEAGGTGATSERLEAALEQLAALQRQACWDAADTIGRTTCIEDRLRAAEAAAETCAAEVEQLTGTVQELRDGLALREAELGTIAASRSWRLTRPLRALAARLRRG
jgi:hypothetical protein